MVRNSLKGKVQLRLPVVQISFSINDSAINDSALSSCFGFSYAASTVRRIAGRSWTEGRILLSWN